MIFTQTEKTAQQFDGVFFYQLIWIINLISCFLAPSELQDEFTLPTLILSFFISFENKKKQ